MMGTKGGISAAAFALIILTGPARAGDTSFLWARTYNGATFYDDSAEAVAMDRDGNVLAAGWTRSADGTGANILVIKYSPAGAVLWSATFNDTVNGEDYAFGAAADPVDGSFYVAGSVTITGGTSAAWLRKYTPWGDAAWTVVYSNTPTGAQSVFYSVAVDPVAGAVYAAGSVLRPDLGAVGEAGNWLVMKYDRNSGLPLWPGPILYNNTATSMWDEATAVTTDPQGNVVVAGYETNLDDGGHLNESIMGRRKTLLAYFKASNIVVDTGIRVMRFAPDRTPIDPPGVYRNELLVDTATNRGNARKYFATGVAADRLGNVVVAGTIEVTSGLSAFSRWARGYSFTGFVERWTQTINQKDASIGAQDYCMGAAYLPAFEEVVLAGSSLRDDWFMGANMTGDNLHFGNGGFVGNFFYDNGKYPGPRSEYGRAVTVGASGTLALAGYEERPDLGQGMNWLVTLWSPPASPIVPLPGVRAWPNPFDPGTAAGGMLKVGPLPAKAKVRIYTVGGLLVREVKVEEGLSGEAGIALWDGRSTAGGRAAPGVYYYVATAPGMTRARGAFMLVRR